MKFTSHLLLADYLYEYLLEETGHNLDYGKFKYGHVKPDIRRHYYGVKHYYQESQEVVDQLLNRIEYDSMEIQEFSEILGVIGHFLTDYFCLYHHHRELYNGSKIKHYKYENKLHKVLKSYLYTDDIVSFNIEQDSVGEMIHQARSQYKKVQGSLIIDAAYAVAVTSDVSKVLVNQYILKNNTVTLSRKIHLAAHMLKTV